MHQENKRYAELAEKWLNGTITKEEAAEFSEWYDSTDDSILTIPPTYAGSEEELRKRILSNIKKNQKRPSPVFSLSLAKLAVASVGVIICGASILYFLNRNHAPVHKNDLPVNSVVQRDTIIPGGNRAVLVLEDGTEVLLDTVGRGTIAENAHTKVTKLDDGELAYSSAAANEGSVSFNTLTTPKGGQYAITLVDGTRVWLNSASSIRFPTSFKGSERTVELTGEAYFEVARHHSMVFKVKVNDIEVKVLGTHFNIMAYNDEAAVNTTLLEGSVSINRQKEIVLLRPGQQAQIKASEKIGIIKNADIGQAIAWKNGIFNFNGSDIEATMRQIARWYDIEVIYEDKITEHFNGSIPRNASIEKVLNMLEHTGVVHFNRQGRKIFVRF